MESLLLGPGVKTRLLFPGSEDEDSASSIALPSFEGRLIMVYSRSRGGWEFPGGKRKPHERPRECALREMREETGLWAHDFRLLCSYMVEKGSATFIGSVYACTVDEYLTMCGDPSILGIGAFRDCPKDLAMRDGFIELMFRELLPKR